MKILGKTDDSFIIEITPNELKDVIAWDDKANGALDLHKLDIGHTEVAADKYKQIISIKDIKQKISDAKVKVSQVVTELDNIDLAQVPESMKAVEK